MTATTTKTIVITQVFDSCLLVFDVFAMISFYNKKHPAGIFSLNGGSRGARTPDLLGVNEALEPTELATRIGV